MASYTMQLRTYIESFSQDDPFKTVNPPVSQRDKIENGRVKLFDFDYPIFDPVYKKVFETHFIRNFYMREIGFETEGLFKFQLETWLIINMPYFNQLFESELIEFDPLTNAKMNVTSNKKADKTQNDTRDKTKSQTINDVGSSTTDQTSTVDQIESSDNISSNDTTFNQNTNGTITNDDFTRHVESDTPDGRLNLTTNDGQGVIEYASKIKEDNTNNKETNSSATDGSGHSESTSNTDATLSTDTTAKVTDSTTHDRDLDSSENDKLISAINDVEDFIEYRVGKIGAQSYPKMIQEFRQSFLRIEKQIFKEMQELFMLVY